MLGLEMMLKQMLGEETMEEIERLKRDAPHMMAEVAAYARRVEEKIDYILRVQSVLIKSLEDKGVIDPIPRVGDMHEQFRLDS